MLSKNFEWFYSISTSSDLDLAGYCWYCSPSDSTKYEIVSRLSHSRYCCEFDNVPGGTRTIATNPTVGQLLVLSVLLANFLLQALIIESHSLTRQISGLSDRQTTLDVVLRDLQRVASRSPTPLPDQ
ncbi:flocculation protein FLO11-like [Cucumis melo var. makuwa]|uniref:Flocculation protein FLO11-like n=1 Tax=Cucumis melo var. makuwa TaxID=1194695 RepID=A0A5D3DCR9_CUCMM|nr:flocculation protein FLO11-like [Cucumis melo var. makuwa]TYK21079.1 flocculation protein FLO11-like [Cucumis melo var. makuwa]